MKYNVYQPSITDKEKQYVIDCLDSTWISSKGKYIDLFEKRISEYVGAEHAVSVHNGTEALHLALLAFGIKPEDDVIAPDFSYVATANAIKYIGANPILVDVCPNSWNITLENIMAAMTSKVRAIIITDIYGTPPADFEEIMLFAEKTNVVVIEDSAESLGALYGNRKAGILGDIGVFSFFGNKIITTGEGGMLVTDNDDVAKYLRQLRNQGNSENIRYFHDVLGYNYRMTNIQAAIGCAQIERIDDILKRKQEIAAIYKEELSNYCVFQQVDENIVSSNWMVSFLLKDNNQRTQLVDLLNKDGIETRPFFHPIHTMPYYVSVDNPVTESITLRGISVPSYPDLTDEDIYYISNKIKEVLNNV